MEIGFGRETFRPCLETARLLTASKVRERLEPLKGEALPSTAPALTPATVDRAMLVDWYRRNRARSRELFDMLDPDAYYTRPIALRNPIVFYEGHLPAFSVIALLKRGLGSPGVDPHMERLFERGIDPDSVEQAVPTERRLDGVAIARRSARATATAPMTRS